MSQLIRKFIILFFIANGLCASPDPVLVQKFTDRVGSGLSLYLTNEQLKDDDAEAIAEVLKTNNTLLILDLKENNIGNAGVTALGEALEVNKTLKFLDLKGNKFSDDGVKNFAQSLKNNLSLQELNLSSNWFFDDGFLALANLLDVNSTIEKLILPDINSSAIDVSRGRIKNSLQRNFYNKAKREIERKSQLK